MIEVKIEGNWPETAIKDIGEVRSKLMEFNLDSPRILLIGPHHLLNNLDARYEETLSTYRTMLKENGLINDDIRLRTDDKFAILYGYSLNTENFPKIDFETAKIKINNIRSVRNKNTQKIVCPECEKEIEIPLGNREGDYYKWCKCGCGYEVTISEE